MNLFENAPDSVASKTEEILAKWKDKPQEELLKKAVAADLHIDTLEREKAELRQMYLEQHEELKAKAKLEEYIDRIEKLPRDNQVAAPIANEPEKPKWDPNEFKKIASETYQEIENQKKSTENFSKVQNKLREKYGDNYSNILKDQQNMLGLSDSDVNSLAQKSPEAFFRVMGLNEPAQRESYQAPPRGSQRNDNFAPKVVTRDWNYYQELKKTNPTLYLDPKISRQMEADYLALGDRFGMPTD